MEDFNFEEKTIEEKLEEKEKKAYSEAIIKRRKITKRILILAFLIMGIVYFAIGIGLLAGTLNDIMAGQTPDEELFIPGAVFAILGFLLLDAVPLVIVIFKSVENKPVNYKRYKDQVEKFGYINTYDLSTKVTIMEQQIKELYQENEELKKEIKELKNR